jgi:pimeloyl-ACP methyl ester carboxylesterase
LNIEKRLPTFRSHAGELEYLEAYDATLKQWPVPYEEIYIPTRFGDTHVVASGPKDADSIILLHPSGSAATIWCRNVGPLGKHFRTLAVDTISEPNKSILTRAIDKRHQRMDFADWTADLFNGLKIESAHIIGNSFGGFLALNTVLYLPQRVRKCILISPAATFLQIWPWYWHFLPARIVGSLIGSRRMFLRAYEWIWQDFPIEEHLSRLRTINAIEGRPQHSFPTVFSDDELRRIRTPILLLVGDHEVIYEPERVIRQASRAIAGLKTKIILNANHNAEYTAADEVNREIEAFLIEQ